MNDSKEVLFSIVIPTYNRAGFILNTLKTVFDQSFKDFEVIVVDDASTDNTIQLLEPYTHSGKIRLFVHDKNYERAKSRNTGQKNARGQFITFLDSDDFMYENNLKDAFEYIQSHPDTRLFHNLYEMVNIKREVVYRYNFKPLYNPVKEISRGNFFSCIGVFIHKEIYSQVSWDETPVLVTSEDYDYSLRIIALAKKVGRIPKINSGMLEHDTRSMNQLDLETTENRFSFLIHKVETDPVLSVTYKSYLPELKSSLYLFLAGVARKKDRSRAWHYLQMALRTNWRLLKSRNFHSIFFRLIADFYSGKK